VRRGETSRLSEPDPGTAGRTISRMKAATLEQAQSRLRLENQTKVVAQSATTPVTSDLMTVREAAEYLRISRSQLFDLTRHRGRVRMQLPIPCIRFGSRLRFRRSSLDAWLTRLEQEAG
jgi:excisionase family DNA binding protein